MKPSRSFASDAAFLCMLVLLFICIVFTTSYSDELTANTVAFIVVCAVMLITYFTSITAGLVINIVLIFASTSYLLYQLAAQDIPPTQEAYFWIIMLPLLTISIGVLTRGIHRLEADYMRLSKEMAAYATIDDLTGLKNIHAYENELTVYHNISQRNQLTLVLLVLEFRYAGELKTFMGDDRLRDVSVQMSRIIDNTLRGGDTVYLLSKSPYRWGALLLIKPGSAQIVIDRLKNKVAEEEFARDTEKQTIQPEVRIGIGEGKAGDTPQLLLDRAVNNMEYDV